MTSMVTIAALLTALLQGLAVYAETVEAVSDSEARLVSDLLTMYDRRVRFAPGPEATTHVSFGLSLRTLSQLNERDHYMESVSTMTTAWNDGRLVWDRSKYSGIDHVKVPAGDLWTPDIVPLTSIDEDLHQTDTIAIVYATGDVHWNPTLRLRSPCIVNLENFPYDEQNCSIEFASYLYHGSHINLTYYGTPENTLSLGKLQPNPNWQIVNHSSQIKLYNYSCCNETYPVMRFNFLFRRNSPNFFQLQVVCALVLGALVPLSLLLPPDCKERITIEIVVVLCLLVLITKLYDILPLSTGTMPPLGRYYLVTLMLDVVSLLGSTIVLNLHNRGPRRAKVPDVVKGIFLGGLRWVACLSTDTYVPLDDLDAMSMRGLSGKTSGQGQQSPEQDLRGANSTALEKDMEDLGKSVHVLSARFSLKDHHDEVLNEWQQVALVLDRLFFMFSLLAFAVSSIKILA